MIVVKSEGIDWFGLAGFKSMWFELVLMWFQLTWFKITDFFSPIFSISELFLCSAFFKSVASRVFNFTFRCAMPQHAFVIKIRSSPVKKVEAPYFSLWDSIITIPPKSTSSHISTTLHTINLWDYASGTFQWVHTDAIIRVLSEINTHFFLTLWNTTGYFPMTVSLSIN